MSTELVLEAQPRTESGSGVAGRLRREGKVPAVIYGHGITPLSIAVDARELRNALRTEAGLNALINVKLGSDTHLALAREPQVDPVKRTMQHVDFLIVNRDEAVTAEVPINLVGEAEGVKRGGGVLESHLFSLIVKATPDKIPAHIDVDITALNLGDSLHVSDVNLPDGVVCDMDPETAILMIDVPRVAAAATAGEASLGGEGTAESPAS